MFSPVESVTAAVALVCDRRPVPDRDLSPVKMEIKCLLRKEGVFNSRVCYTSSSTSS